jgi:FlaA1/EpsC-like NDP-sugar epimerase
VTVGIAAMLFGKRAPGVYLMAFVVAAFVVVRHLTRVELWDTGRAFLSRPRTAVSRRLVVPIYICIDLLLLTGAWCVSRLLSDLPLTRIAVKSSLPLFVAPTFVTLALIRTYTRVWSRALLREYALIAVAVAGGVLFAAGLIIVTGAQEVGWGRAAFIYLMLAEILLVGLRLAGETIRESVAAVERLNLLDRQDTTRILACGGGERFRLFLRERRTRTGRNTCVVVGVLDDDINLRGRMVFGYSVLGSFEDLPAVAARHRVSSIMITANLPVERRARLVELARRAGLSLSEWVLSERPVA